MNANKARCLLDVNIGFQVPGLNGRKRERRQFLEMALHLKVCLVQNPPVKTNSGWCICLADRDRILFPANNCGGSRLGLFLARRHQRELLLALPSFV